MCSAVWRAPSRTAPPDDERVNSCAIRPGRHGGGDDVSAGVGQRAGQSGQQAVGVTARDLDDPVIGTPLRADGHPNHARPRQRFNEAGLARQLVGLVSEQVRHGRRAQPFARSSFVRQCGRLAPAHLGQRISALAEQLRVAEQHVQLIVQLVEALTVVMRRSPPPGDMPRRRSAREPRWVAIWRSSAGAKPSRSVAAARSSLLPSRIACTGGGSRTASCRSSECTDCGSGSGPAHVDHDAGQQQLIDALPAPTARVRPPARRGGRPSGNAARGSGRALRDRVDGGRATQRSRARRVAAHR